MPNEYLYHHGIKGMKWGVRRNPDQLGHPQTKKKGLFSKVSTKIKKRQETNRKKEAEKAANKEKQIAKTKMEDTKTPKLRDISSKDLQEMINRLNLEKQYNTLMSEMHPKKMKWAKSFVKDVGGHVITKTAKDVGAAYITKQLKDLLDLTPPEQKKKKDT